MQTFLPYRNFHKATACLDKTRLGNQVYREGITLLRGGWKNHPASKMWAGYEPALAEYLLAGMDELNNRGKYYYACEHELQTVLHSTDILVYPPWLLNEEQAERVFASHRSNLLRKDPVYYGQFGWMESADLEYYWPV